MLLFNCGFDSTLHWIKQIRYCFSENARPSLKILWPTQLWVSQWKTHKCRKNTKTITGITFLPAISQTGAQTAVDIFWSFCVCVATLHSEKQKIGLNMVTKRAPIRADHHPVLIWWLYFDVIRSPYLEHDVNTHTPLMVMHYITRDITRILLFCEISKLYKEPDNIRLISIRDVENPSSTAESPGCNWNGG